jgi:hypothetical protein
MSLIETKNLFSPPSIPSSGRPLINESVMPASAGVFDARTTNMRTLMTWVKRSPEPLGIVNRIANDVVTPVSFRAIEKKGVGRPSKEAGLYTLILNNGGWAEIDVPSRPAAIMTDMGSPWIIGSGEYYFYVPPGTNSFIFSAKGTASLPLKFDLTDPSGSVTTLEFTDSAEVPVNSPEAGLWTVKGTAINDAESVSFKLIGILPLIWYDPEYLLVPSEAPQPPPQQDIAAPFRSNGRPTGTLPAGTTEATISLATDEVATCKYSTTAGVSYDSMPTTFATTGGVSHSQLITDLSDGSSYSYYVKCVDSIGNVNADDFVISFSVAAVSGCGDGVCELTEFFRCPIDCSVVKGNSSDVTTNFFKLKVKINESENVTRYYNETLPVRFIEVPESGGEVERVRFDFGFSLKRLLRMNLLRIFKQASDESRGYLLISGVNLTNEKKSILVDKINPSSSSVCVKDAEVQDVSEVSSACNGANEFLIKCDGGTYFGSYSCLAQGSYFNVSGLSNSAVVEYLGPVQEEVKDVQRDYTLVIVLATIIAIIIIIKILVKKKAQGKG